MYIHTIISPLVIFILFKVQMTSSESNYITWTIISLFVCTIFFKDAADLLLQSSFYSCIIESYIKMLLNDQVTCNMNRIDQFKPQLPVSRYLK